MYRVFIFTLVLACAMIKATDGCHAGHTQTRATDDKEDYAYEAYEESDDYEENSSTNGDDNEVSQSRRKRQARQFGEDYDILRRYFRDCMHDKTTEEWDWTSVIDFTILKTLWFFYSGNVECTEETGKDTAHCWKACIDVYLRNTSNLIKPAKHCVDEYQRDFEIDKAVYTPTVKKYAPAPTAQPANRYTKCIQAQYNEASTDTIFDDTGFLSVTAEEALDIKNIVTFVTEHVLCTICDYSTLPSGRSRPNFQDNIVIGETVLVDGTVVYSTSWPFSFEALVRRDARLRYAINFCNNELESTFRKDPPTNLGWTTWYTWASCNADCGKSGLQTRTRDCLDELEKNCPGSNIDTRACVNRDCAHWSTWGEYTPCMSTCGLSEKYSFRECVNERVGDEGCQGERKRSKSCIVASCPVPWSSWSACSRTCGNGAQHRSGGESMMHIKTEARMCNLGECPEVWSQWSPWSSCSKSCGWGGIRERVRRCIGEIPCKASAKEISSCQKYLPPCRMTWSPWSAWSTCTYQKRSRNCYSGSNCYGSSDEFRKCQSNIGSHVSWREESEWSKWSPWSMCDKKCGDGKKVRTRKCTGALGVSQFSCVGKNRQEERCNTKPCKTSGKSLCVNHSSVDESCSRNRFNCKGEIGRRFCKKSCGFC